MKKIIFISLLLFLTGCQIDQTQSKEEGKLHIYTSIYPLEFLANELLEDDATVQSVYPPGVDAHTYEPAARDITAIAKADAFFYVGGHMESFTDTISNTLKKHPVSLHALNEEKDIFLKNEDGEIDPHLWLDPKRMIQVAAWMKEALIAMDPSLQPSLEENYISLEQALNDLDASLQSVSAHTKDRPLLVVHAAYRYWEERYGIKQLAIHGMMAGEESSQKKLATIVRLAKEYDMQYVVYEQNNDDKVADIVRNHIGAEKAIIHDLEVLTDEDVYHGEDYISLMEENIHVLENIFEIGGDSNE